MDPTSRRTPLDAARLLLAAACLVLLGTATACSGGGGSDSGESAADSSAGSADSAASAVDADRSVSEAEGVVADRAGRASDGAVEVREAALISTGTVSLRAEDVADARFDVQKVADRYAGQVTDSETRTAEDGAVRETRLVLRVPSDDFTEAMDELEKVAELESSTSTSEDVTSQVVDTAVRIRVQRESIARIEELLARAGSIRDVVAVERQLTTREARLNSLLGQQAYLEDQTSMSTITVHVERSRDAPRPEPEEAGAGFLTGLGAGWDALAALTLGLVTALGAALPFAVVLLVVGWPAWSLLRRRRTTSGAGAAPAVPAAEG